MSKAPTTKKTANASEQKTVASEKATEKTASTKTTAAKGKTATVDKVSTETKAIKPEAITLIPAESESKANEISVPGEVPTDKVAACAYYMWEKDGCQHGRDTEHWFRAEEQIRKEIAATKRK